MAMLSHERQREVLRHLRLRGAGSVNDLAQAVGVSASTIRRDLTEMDGQGLLRRVHGGASLPGTELEVAPTARELDHAVEKRRIGLAAAALIEDNATVLITGGTTTAALLSGVQRRVGLTVITNNLTVAVALARQPEATVVVLGGILRHAELSLLGPMAETAVQDFEVDLAFTGSYGVDPEVGLTGASVHEASTDRRLLQGARRIVVLADGSKFFRRGPVRLAATDSISVLVTDVDAPPEGVAAFRAAGVDVRLV